MTAPVALAQVSGEWLDDSSSNNRQWSNALLWSSAPYYPDGGGAASFTRPFPIASPVTLNVDVTLGRINVDATGAVAVSGRGGAHRVTFTAPATIDAGANARQTSFGPPTLDFTLVSSEGFLKTGPGTVSVNFGDPTAPASAQPLKGDIRIQAGVLHIVPSEQLLNPLGDPANRVTLDGGAHLTIRHSTNLAWALQNPIDVAAGGGTVAGYGNATVTVAGPVSGSGTLELAGDPTSVAAFGRLAFTAVNPLTGEVVHDGRSEFRLAGGGAFPDTRRITTYSTFTLDYATPGGAIDRIGDSTAVALAAGARWTATAPPAGAPVNERVGPIELIGGDAWIEFAATPADRALTVTAAALDRAGRGIATFYSPIGTPAPTNATRLLFATPPATVGSGAAGGKSVGIIPGAFMFDPATSNLTLTTYTAATGVRQLTAAEFAVGDFPAPGTPQNVRLTGSRTPAGPRTVNALSLASVYLGPDGVLGGNNKVTINSGVVLAETPWTIAAPLDFAGREAIVLARSVLNLSGPITNADGLTVNASQYSATTLSGASTFAGPVLLSGDVLIASSVAKNVPGPLGASDAPVVLVGPSTTLMLAYGATFGRDIEVRTVARGEAAIEGTAHITGNVTGTGALAGRRDLDFDGVISGPLKLQVGSGVVRLNADNTFTGGINVGYGGVLAPARDGVLGANPLHFEHSLTYETETIATLRADRAPLRINNDILIAGGARFDGDHPIELAGRVEIAPGNGSAAVVAVYAPVTITGQFVGGGYTKSGSGTLTIDTADPVAAGGVSGGLLVLRNPVDRMSVTTSGGGVLRIEPGHNKMIVVPVWRSEGPGGIDLTDNAMATYGTVKGVAPLVKAGRNGGTWDGPYIRSSTVAAAPHRFGVGYAGAADVLDFKSGPNQTFLGAAVTSNMVVFRPTLLGDANLDGIVNFTDLVALAQHYNSAAGSAYWAQGDFTYDGLVNFDDLVRLAQNYNTPFARAAVPGSSPDFRDALRSAAALVPEPNTCLVACGAACFATMRRRQRPRA